MTITVAALKRALVELRDEPEHGACDHFAALSRNPTALTMLAERLSVRPAPARDWDRPKIEGLQVGERVRYACSTNPFGHKGGTVLRFNDRGNPVIQWDNWAFPTSVTLSMIEREPAS